MNTGDLWRLAMVVDDRRCPAVIIITLRRSATLHGFTAVCKANGTSDHFLNKNKLITSLLVALIASAILDEISWNQVRSEAFPRRFLTILVSASKSTIFFGPYSAPARRVLHLARLFTPPVLHRFSSK
jgi:hypothetical protein